MNDKTRPDAKATLAAQAMRQQAEDLVRAMAAGLPASAQDLSPQNLLPQAMRRALHELQVHQIELEMQNEELRRTQLELDASRERYFDLYDLAPVAYCTVSEQGQILEANMTAATLLGMSRRTLVGQRISRFIVKSWQDTYYLHNQSMFTSGEPQAYELQMTKGDGVNFWVNMAATLAQDASGTPLQRIVLNDVTDAKLMVAAVQASEARFRALVEWSPDAIVVHRDGKIIFVNPATLDMFGAKTPYELVGKAMLDRVHPDFRAMVMERVKKVSKLTNIAPPMMEEVLLKLDGTPINVEVQNIFTVYDDAPAIQVTMRNITDRRRAEEAALEAQGRLHYAANAARLTYVEVDLVAGGARTADNFAAVMGYASPAAQESDAALGVHALLTHVVPADRTRVQVAVESFISGKLPGQIDYRVLGDDQVERWIESSWSLEHTASGKLLKAFATNIDITQRKRAELALRDSEERYRNLFNSIDTGFCVIDVIFDAQQKPVDYRFLEINPSFEKQSGMVDAVGKRLLEFTSELEPYWFEMFGKVAVTGEAIRFVRSAKPLGGRTFDLYAFKVGGPDGRKVAILFTNITERRQEEVHKELLSRELRGKHTDLVLAMASAEKANRVKTDFLSSMSHELRTPLSAILGFAQLLESGKPAPTASQKRSIDQILKAGWYLLELINEILDLAKIESGKLSLSMQPTPLEGVLRECEALIGPMAQKGGLSVSFAAPQAAYAVQADPTRMKQVLFNLLSNAVKYNKAGGTVNVACRAVTPARVRISVEDTGKGLTPQQITQLFEPFNRLGQEATAVQGTGIGLVMTKRLVEMMGGEIGVHSTVGMGSVFWVEMNLVSVLPSSAEVEVKVEVEVAAEVEANLMAKSLCTLLYVEDNPASLMLMQDLMARRPDIHLLTATDALSGVTLARAERPDVILMDINLPGISGLEALNILLGDPRTAHIPVVALSANAIPADIARGLAAGFFSYLTKPLKVNELMQTLDAASQFAKATPGAPMALPREQA